MRWLWGRGNTVAAEAANPAACPANRQENTRCHCKPGYPLTTATDGDDGDHEAVADDSVTVNDEVSYTGLTPG